MTEIQSQENDSSVIWFDDFDEVKLYLESTGGLDSLEFFGSSGCAM